MAAGRLYCFNYFSILKIVLLQVIETQNTYHGAHRPMYVELLPLKFIEMIL